MDQFSMKQIPTMFYYDVLDAMYNEIKHSKGGFRKYISEHDVLIYEKSTYPTWIRFFFEKPYWNGNRRELLRIFKKLYLLQIIKSSRQQKAVEEMFRQFFIHCNDYEMQYNQPYIIPSLIPI